MGKRHMFTKLFKRIKAISRPAKEHYEKTLSGLRSKGTALKHMRRLGWTPRTVFDIGVATGTKGLYGIFDEVCYVLIDPVSETEIFMQELCRKYPGSRYFVLAASESDGETQIAISPGFSGSSIHKMGKDRELRIVPTRRLDSIDAEHNFEAPFLIKIDTEGHELNTLRGAAQCLKKTDVVIAEVSLWSDKKKQKTGATTFDELVLFLKAQGFVLYDIVDVVYRPIDAAMGIFDAVFAREDCSLRKESAFRTPSQHEEIDRKKTQKFEGRKADLLNR
jgi:FkbM family methyltransferase